MRHLQVGKNIVPPKAGEILDATALAMESKMAIFRKKLRVLGIFPKTL
jgi:hypothetical protein